MAIRFATITLILCLPFFSQAQQNESSAAKEAQDLPESIQVIGDRSIMQLRVQMMEAEKKAYEIFNKFNDEKRFEIHCTMHNPTGSRINRQVCTTGFENEASRVHAQAYYDDMFGTSNTVHVPFEVLVASQQEAYKKKIKQVAEENPEFLNAVIQFSEMRQRYEAATSTGNNN